MKKNIYNIKTIGIGSGLLLVLGLTAFNIFGVEKNQAPSVSMNTAKDPLQQLLGDILESPQDSLKADFFNNGEYLQRNLIRPYSGIQSQDISTCITTSPSSINEGTVYAKLDNEELSIMLAEKEAGTFDRIAVRNEIFPVFGHAYKHSEMNWDWKPEEKMYEFYIDEGSEALWKCYFDLQEETEFFPRFFESTWYTTSTNTVDTDGDGMNDDIDTDDDNDGISDADEIQLGTNPLEKDSNNDGINDGDEDADGDGIPNKEESDETKNTPTDTDNDGIIDALDTDSDNDGINDSIEGNTDSDGDGIPDFQDTDSDNDTIPDATEGIVDTDSDGIPNYLDEDSDNDELSDKTEGTDDIDNDGLPNYIDLDSDGDGIPDKTDPHPYGPNTAPVGKNDTATTDNATSILIDVLANDTDTEGDSLQITKLSGSPSGTIAVENGKIRYTPSQESLDTDIFTYVPFDGFLEGNITIVQINIVSTCPNNTFDHATTDGCNIFQ